MKQHPMSEVQATAHFMQINPQCKNAYRALTGNIQVLLWHGEPAPRNTNEDPRYKELEQLIENAALEICGNPLFDGSSFDLLMKLHQLVEEKRDGIWTESATKTMWNSVDDYLGRMRRYMLETVYKPIGWSPETIPQHYTYTALDTLSIAASESAAIPRWFGIATHHFLKAAVYLMLVALKFMKQPTTSDVIYAGEKVLAALTDTYYAIREVNELGPRTPIIFRSLLTRMRAAAEPARLTEPEE